MVVAAERGAAFAVCIDEYDHVAELMADELPGARRGAEEFLRLACSLGFSTEEPIISGTYQEIAAALNRIAESTAPRKLIYWVGHGYKDGQTTALLLCRDWKGPRRVDGAFDAADMARRLTLMSGDVLLIVDTCFASDFARHVHPGVLEREDFYREPPAGPDGPAGPGRSVGCVGTVAGGELSQVGAWLAAFRQVCLNPDYEFREGKLWSPYSEALHAADLLGAVTQELRHTSTQVPMLFGGQRLIRFFGNPYYDPFARPISAAAPGMRAELLGRQVRQLLESKFAGLRLEGADERFVGRRYSLQRVTEWLGSPGRGGVMVVTGPPGSGKSALLGQVALMTIQDTPEYNGLPPEQRGRLAGAINVGIRCRGRSAMECARELAAGMEIKEPDVGWTDIDQAVAALVTACEKRGEAAFLVDGLDEADPAHLDSIIADLLRPLAAQPRVKVLVGTRPTIGASSLLLLDAVQLDLDEDPERDEDVATYVREKLGAPDCPYSADPAVLKAATDAVVSRSQGVFLVARLYCSALARLDRALPPSDAAFQRILVSGLQEALAQELRDLDRIAAASPARHAEQRRAGWARGLLLPLALAHGAGLPDQDGIWLESANALAALCGLKLRYTSDDIRAVLRVAGAHIEHYGEAGQHVYRLYHEAMVDHVVRSAGPRPHELHSTMTDVLLRIHHAAYRGSGSTNPYIARYAAAHAAAAGRLEELVEDGEFLVNADPERLITLLDQPDRAPSSSRAQLYRRVAEELTGKSPRERAALLQATALRHHPELVSWARSSGALPWRDRWTTAAPATPSKVLRAPYGDVCAVAGAADPEGGILGAGEQLWRWPASGGTPQLLRGIVVTEAGRRANRMHALAVPGRPSLIAAVAADAERVLVWPSDEREPVRILGWGAGIGSVAVGGDGDLEVVAATSGASVGTWEWTAGRLRHRGFWQWPHKGRPQAVAVAELASTLCVVAVGDGGGVVWDAHTGARVFTFGEASGRCDALAVAASGPDSHVAVVCSRPPNLRVWRITGSGDGISAEHVLSAKLRSLSSSGVAIGECAHDTLVAALDGGTTRIWDLRARRELAPLEGHRTRPTGLAFLRDGSGRVTVADGVRVRVWDPPGRDSVSAERPGMPAPGSEHAGAAAVSELGTGAVALAGGGTARVWDLSGRHLHDEQELTRVVSVALAAGKDGRMWLAVGGRDDAGTPRVRVRDLAEGRSTLLRLDRRRDTDVRAVALSASGNGMSVFAAANRHIHRWDVTTGEPLPGYYVTTGVIDHLAVVESPRGDAFLAATAGDSAWVWPGLAPGRPLRFRLSGGPARALAGTHGADGRRWFAVATSAGVFLGCLDTPRPPDEPATADPLPDAPTDVYSLAFATAPSGYAVVLLASRTRVIHEWIVGMAKQEVRRIADRGYDVHNVHAVPVDNGLLVAAVGLERMDLLHLADRRM